MGIMKRTYIFIVSASLLASCSTVKRVTNKSVKVDSICTSYIVDSVRTLKVIDTTRTEESHTIVTEILFTDSADTTTTAVFDGVGVVRGARVKSIKRTEIGAQTEKKGQTLELADSSQAVKAKTAYKSTAVTKTKESPKDQYRWRYIAIVAAIIVVAVVLVYLKRTKIATWLKRVL